MDYEDEFKRSLTGSIIFKRDGEKTLDRIYIPEKVPHREELIKKMLFDFKGFLKDGKCVNIGVKGGGGFGKTLISRFVLERLNNVTSDLGINFESKYYTCFQHRTLGAILRDYLPQNYHIPGKGFSISELVTFLVKNLQREEKKLVFIVDEIQNLKEDEIMRILSINEDFKTPEDPRDFLSVILIARDYDWNNILAKEPRIAQRVNSFITLPKYNSDDLLDIMVYRRDLAFFSSALSDDNVELVADMAEISGNVYYAIELMHHAGKRAEQLNESEILPEMIRGAAKFVSSEFREPVLDQLKIHELMTLYATARILERLNKENVNRTTTNDAYDEYCLACEEKGMEPHVLSAFRKYIQKLHQNRLIREKIKNIETRGRRAELNIIDFSAELVKEKVGEVLEKRMEK